MSARGRAAAPPEVRFWNYVQESGDCWLWTASVRPDGYGEFRVNGRLTRAHRFAYEQMVGPIPEGLILDHLCRVRRCVRPAHLDPVTFAVNSQRGASAHIIQTGRCIHGHVMDAGNTYIRPDTGQHLCRRCRADESRLRARRAASPQRKSA